MKTHKLITILLTTFFAVQLTAQSGKIVGSITDGDYNEPMAFANVLVKNTTTGTTSDFDGKYQLEISEGIYTIIFSYIGYQSIEISDVNIGPDSEVIVDVTLKTNSLDAIVITTTIRKNTESAVLDLQKKSITLLDGLSAQSIKSSGASNIASAVKSVPGVSIQGGKYVYVRGLGDRYTKSILNGVDIPGLDPDRNTIQMDVFPTNILENVIVIKSAAAEYPADFTGGVIDIITKDYPSKKSYTLSMGTSYNPNMHLNSNYLSYTGSNTDWLGFDNGMRKRPINRYQPIPGTFANSSVLTALTGAFNKELTAKRSDSGVNYDFGFTAGDQYDIGDDKLGYQLSFSYKNKTEFYDNRVDGTYMRDQNNASNNDLLATRTTLGEVGVNSVVLNLLAGLVYKREDSKYKLNFLHIQNGESTAGRYEQQLAQAGGGSGFEPITKDALLYSERSITNVLLAGKHSLRDSGWQIDWKLSPSLSRVYDKDHRITPLQVTQEGNSIISPSASSYPIRIWRTLEEINLVGKLDVNKKYTFFNNPAKVKFGGGYTYKYRDFKIDDYTFTITNPTTGLSVEDGDADNLLAENNIWTPQTGVGTHLVNGDLFEQANAYEGEQRITAMYASNEFSLTEKLKTVLGIRTELFQTFYTGQNQAATEVYKNSKIIDKFDVFPS